MTIYQMKMLNHKLDHVAIRGMDMNRDIDYYLDLGFNLEWESPDWSYFTEGVALLGPEYNRADPHFAIRLKKTKQLAKLRAILDDYESGPIHEHRDGTISFYTRDPEGNQLEFICQGIGINT